jgi:hypothetical protein
VLTAFFFARGEHLWLPGVWMLCYGQGTGDGGVRADVDQRSGRSALVLAR